MRDGLETIARTIKQIVNTKKTLHGTRADLLIELRDEGALGGLDRGIRRERRSTPRANLQKFKLLEKALERAIQAGYVLATTDEDGVMLLGALHIKPDVSATPETPVATMPERLPYTGAQFARLRSWGESVSV
jgi:hypothetical protein